MDIKLGFSTLLQGQEDGTVPPMRAPMINEEQKKVFTSSDALYSSEKVGEEQKKVSSSSDALH